MGCAKTVPEGLEKGRLCRRLYSVSRMREAKPERRTALVLDNLRTHHARKVKKEAERLIYHLTLPT